MYILIILLSVVSALVIWFYKLVFSHWKNEGLNYIQPTIPWGNARALCTNKFNFGELFANIFAELRKRGLKHGGAYFFWNPIYMPTDPVIIKDILIGNFDNFRNHGFYISTEDPLTRHMFNLEDNRWRDIRYKLSHCFTSGKMKSNFIVMKKYAETLNSILEKHAEENKCVDIKVLLSRYTTDVITCCTMGVEANTLTGNNEELLKHGRYFFDKAWSKLNNIITLIIPRPILHKIGFRVTPIESEVYWRNLFNTIKNERIKSKQIKNDLLDSIIKLSDKSHMEKIIDFSGKYQMETLCQDESVAQAYVFFQAGFETSSATLTFALYELAKNPNLQQRLRDEIIEVFEKYNGEITYNAVQEVEYLEMVLKETLRLYPALPLIPRKCNEDYKVPGTEFTLKKDTAVIISNMGLHRDPEFWPNPEKWDPERFSSKNIGKIVPFTFLPFGEGPRLCIAHRFGQLQAKTGIFTIIKDYFVYVNDKTIKPFAFCKKGLVLKTKGDMWLDFEKVTY